MQETQIDCSATTINTPNEIELQLKRPKRTLHFSDGIIEEFTDEEDEVDDGAGDAPSKLDVDESKMTWGPWMLYKASTTGNTVLAGLDYVGESLASIFGITEPKYNYEIQQYKKAQAQKEADAKDAADEEKLGWTETTTTTATESLGDATLTKQAELNKY